MDSLLTGRGAGGSSNGGMVSLNGLLQIDQRLLADLDHAYPRMRDIEDQDDDHGNKQRQKHAA